MEAPKRIWTKDEELPAMCRTADFYAESQVKYIRADLVDKLKGYAVHKYDCRADEAPEGVNPCTCGLTEVLREME